MLLLEKSSDFATELDDFVDIVQILAALVIKTKAGGVLESVWDDSSRHLLNREFADFFTEEFEIFINLE